MALAKPAATGGTGSSVPDPYHKVVAPCIKIALSLIRSKEGLASLVNVGQRTLQELKPHNRGSCAEPSELPSWAKSFNDQLSRKFVNVDVPERGVDGEARFVPSRWDKNAGKWAPDRAGRMNLREYGWTRSPRGGGGQAVRDVRNRFAFNTGLGIARGLVHCFFYTLAPFAKEARLKNGDVAQIWEGLTFGGQLMTEEEIQHKPSPYGRMFEHLWLVKPPGNMAGRIELPAALGASSFHDFKLPLKTIGSGTPVEELRKRGSTNAPAGASSGGAVASTSTSRGAVVAGSGSAGHLAGQSAPVQPSPGKGLKGAATSTSGRVASN
ncbi:hypothetical protein C8A00DRAFT_33858 [Chaetomidium leptoderma]|uniref:Uncharacterized protein n=1 Tax=Chaetomidium leptoderma TaxID=669021 RepID=A0AAN6ZX06_9PEZI|nr:hypothetical protein C8A00DRAFT_33858 [Chaetomidium leptoderma]